ncbi:MAG: hypothetical protein ACLFNT_00160 [Spirochaetales bacterium]
MSTTPSTSDISYTVVGERRLKDRGTVTAIILNRGGRQSRAEYLDRLLDLGVAHVITLLDPAPHYDIEQLASRSAYARFVTFSRPTTLGNQINIAAREVTTPRFLVLWSGMEPSSLTARVLSQIDEIGSLCVVPAFRTRQGELAPTVVAPAFFGSKLRTIPVQPNSTGALSLYPYAMVGLYDRAKFELVGGFDERIENPYWQLLDFGFRAYLWGEQIAALPSLRVHLSRDLPAEDSTPDESYARFHLKNLAVRFVRDQGRLPRFLMVPFLLRSGMSMRSALRTFGAARAWVRENRYRFVQDARRVTELWEVEE